MTGAGLALAALAIPGRPSRATERAEEGEAPYELPERAVRALDESPLVYVSPLKSNGAESRCHGEVWFFHDRGDVVLATGRNAWKSRALRKDLDRARIWVGDFGPVGSAGDRYRKAPSFLARASFDEDAATFRRLLDAYGKKYPDEWDRWKPRFERSYEQGSRLVIRYTPIAP